MENKDSVAVTEPEQVLVDVAYLKAIEDQIEALTRAVDELVVLRSLLAKSAGPSAMPRP